MSFHCERSQAAVEIFKRALAASSVANAFAAKLARHPREPHRYVIRGGADEPSCEVDLRGIRRVIVIAAGKGAATMLESLLTGIELPPACLLSGILVAPRRPALLPDGIEFFTGGHPLPNAQSFAAARAALALIQQTAAEVMEMPAFGFFLISGGASAMMELPLDDAISLDDTVAFYRELVHSGAPIAEINCVRKHFSAMKGGRLGLAAASLPQLSLLLSDVPAGELDALASGPTVPDCSTLAQCRGILERYALLPRFPASIQRFFLSPALPETPKPGSFAARAMTLLASSDLAEAARQAAEDLGFHAVIDSTCDDWDYRRAAEYLLAKLRELRRSHERVCLIAPGEVTVELPSNQNDAGSPGVGGRNQHFALYAATLLFPSDGLTTILSAGSDGVDGNSRFAGAVVDSETLRDGGRAASAQDALRRFDSSTFLDSIGATIWTGATGNNLRDLRLLLAE